MNKIFTFGLDILQNVQNSPLANIKTNDLNTAFFNINVTRGKYPYSLTNAEVRLNIEKPDNTIVMLDGSLLDPENGTCQFALTKQAYLLAGRHKGELMISYQDNQIAVTKTFYYIVEKGLVDDEVLESRDEWSSLARAIAAGEALTDEAIEMMQLAEKNEPVRIQNEQLRVANEETRQFIYHDMRDFLNAHENINRIPYYVDAGDFGDTADGMILDGGDFITPNES